MLYLYPAGTKNMAEGGIPLAEAKNDILIEVLNGRYTLSFEYPTSGEIDLREELEHFSIIGADTPRTGVQPFYISNLTKAGDVWEIEAKHVFFLLESFSTRNLWITGRASSVIEEFRVNTDNPNLFTFSSNIGKRIHIRTNGEKAMEVLANGDESILAKTQGQLLRDGFHVGVMDRIGEQTQYLLAERKNINDLKKINNWEGITTRLEVNKKIDHKKFIPTPNGKGKLTEVFPEGGGAPIRVRYWDSTTARLIENGEGHFQVFDANGYSVIGGMQTGSHQSIITWREKEKKYKETLAKEKERLPEVTEKVGKARRELTEALAERESADRAYINNPTVSNRKRFEAAKRNQEGKQKAWDSAKEQKATVDKKIKEYTDLVNNIPTVILGERWLDNALAPGEYFIRMTKPAEGYLPNHDVYRIESDGVNEVLVDYYSNPESYPEDDTVWAMTTVNSPVIDEYPYIFSEVIELGQDYDDLEAWGEDQTWVLDFEQTRQNLYNWGYEQFLDTRMDLPSETLTFKAGSEVINSGLGLGDTAVIQYSDYDIQMDIPVTEIQYSPMKREYISLTFGDRPDSVFSSMTNTFKKNLDGLASSTEQAIKGVQRSTADSLTATEIHNKIFTIDALSEADLERYFDNEFMKQSIMEWVNEVGLENITRTDMDIADLYFKGEELDARFGTIDERIKEDRETIEKIKADAVDTIRDVQQLGKDLIAEREATDEALKNLANDVIAEREATDKAMAGLKTEFTTSIDGVISRVVGLDGKYSNLSQTVDGVKLSVSDVKGKYYSLNTTVNGVKSSVVDLEGNVSEVKQSVKEITSSVVGLDGKYSNLSQTVEGVKLSVSDVEGKYYSLNSTVNGIKSSVIDLEGNFSSVNQTVEGVTTSISSIEGSITRLEVMDKSLTSTIASVKKGLNSSISQTDERISLLVAGKGTESTSFINMLEGRIKVEAPVIDLSGYVTFTDLASARGSTVIHGSNIKTGTLSADRVSTGILSSSNKATWLDLSTGEFSFMNGALTHERRSTDTRGAVKCHSSFAVTYAKDSSKYMMEANAGGLGFYDDTSYNKRVATIRPDGNRHLLVDLESASKGFAIRYETNVKDVYQGKVFVAENIKDAFGISTTNSYSVYITGSLAVTGDIRCQGRLVGETSL